MMVLGVIKLLLSFGNALAWHLVRSTTHYASLYYDYSIGLRVNGLQMVIVISKTLKRPMVKKK